MNKRKKIVVGCSFVVYLWTFISVLCECIKFFNDPTYGNSLVLSILDVTVKENIVGGFILVNFIFFIPLFCCKIKTKSRCAFIIWLCVGIVAFIVFNFIFLIDSGIFCDMSVAVIKAICIIEIIYCLISFVGIMCILRKQ